MTYNRKAISFFLAVLTLAAVTASASCGDGSGVGQHQDSKTDVETTQAAAEPSYLDQYDGVDLGAQIYTLAVSTSPEFPNYAGETPTGESVNDAQYERDNWIEEQYNVDLQYVPYAEDGVMASDVQKQVQAGDTSYDCLQGCLNGGLITLSSAGVLADLRQIEGLDLTADWWSQSFNQRFTVNNIQSLATGPISFSYFYSPRLVAYNLRLAEDYNMPDLYAVVNEGKWTLDYMYDLIKDFSADLDGDGKMGEDDLWGASVDEYSAAGFFISAGGEQMRVDADGKPYFVMQEDRNVQIIEKVASVIGNAELTQKAEDLASRSGSYDIRDKVYTFKNGNALFLGYGAQAIAFYLRDMEDDYGIIPVPKYDEAQTDYITFGNAHVPGYVALPMNNERGEINGIVLNTMGYISKRDVQPLINEVLLKGKAARDEASQHMIDLIYHDMYLDLNSSYNFGDSFILLRDVTMGKKENFSSQWAKTEKRATKALDNFYEQYSSIGS